MPKKSAINLQTDLFANESKAASDAILSVQQVTTRIKSLIEESIPALWIRAEISNLRKQASGHLYFTLKDESSQLSAVLFRANATSSALIKDGAQILAYGEISVYEPRGTYQIIVRAVMPDGHGRLQTEFNRLKEQLNREGVFSQKKPLPTFPKRVALITSPTGAALQDILSVIQRRNWPGEITIYPALVQGDTSAASLREQLIKAQFENFDLIILARGGGSLEDLWSFNDEALVRAIAACSTPTICAVGHEIDFTLSDFAADWRAETPTAAAEWLCSGADRMRENLRTLIDRYKNGQTKHFENLKTTLKHLQVSWIRLRPQTIINHYMQRLDDVESHLKLRVQQSFSQKSTQLAFFSALLHPKNAKRSLDQWPQKVSYLKKSLFERTQKHLTRLESHLSVLKMQLEASSLDRTLQRGFVLMQDDKGQFITQSQGLTKGQGLKAQFHDGQANLKVESTEVEC
jgi:exodeoxyribonuclease VII large subunit